MNLAYDAVSYNKDKENFMKIITYLRPDDIKKFYFLTLDHKSELSYPQTAEDFFELKNFKNEEDKKNLLKELLFYIKKYKLLRMLGTCQHQMKINLRNGPCYIDSGRLLIFNLCEDLKNSDIQVLKTILNKDDIVTDAEWENVAGEYFFSKWLREITKDKITRIQKALPSINYKNIKTFEEEFRNYFEKPFPVTTPSSGKPCGLAIIFIFENFNFQANVINKARIPFLSRRIGTAKDEKSLIDLWHQYGFDVLVFQDLMSTIMIQVMDVLQNVHYNEYSIFVSCILTHGSRGMIYTSDNIPLDIYKDIAYKICVPALQDKPKLFFIQACQEDLKKNTSKDDSSLDSDSNFAIPILNRYLMVAMSTTPMNLAFRENCESWFIRDLYDVFTNSDPTSTDLIKLVNRVNSKVTERSGTYGNKTVTQTPELRQTVMRPLYLKRLENCFVVQKSFNYNNRPLLCSLIEKIRVKPDIYLI